MWQSEKVKYLKRQDQRKRRILIQLDVDSAAREANLLRHLVAVTGLVMMWTNMFYFPMLAIVAIGIMTDLRYVLIIITKDIMATGRLARNVGILLRQRYMCGMVPTNIILRN